MRGAELGAVAAALMMGALGCAELDDEEGLWLEPAVGSSTLSGLDVAEPAAPIEPDGPTSLALAPSAGDGGSCGCPGGLFWRRPADDGPAPGDGEGLCRVRMIDDHNGIDTTLEVERTDACAYLVTDGVGSEAPWEVRVEVSPTGLVETDAGVPAVTCREILEEAALAADGDEQLTFLGFDELPCSPFARGLVYFLVMEWFYFG